MPHGITLGEALFCKDHAVECPPIVPDVIDICGIETIEFDVLPSELNPLRIAIRCGEYIKDRTIVHYPILEIKQLGDWQTESIIVSNNQNGMLPVPEPPLWMGMCAAILSIIVIWNVKRK